MFYSPISEFSSFRGDGDSQRGALYLFTLLPIGIIPKKEKLNLNAKRFDQLFEGS